MVDVSIYKNLQSDFVMIRFLYSDTVCDAARLNRVKSDITMLRSILEEQSPNAHPLLLYCIEVLFEIIDENNRVKVFDFADLIHNMPEIYFGERTIRTFKREIRIFNKKYKTKYFTEYIRLVHPQPV